jgi:signal transduction histidine kinase/DNA-binding response OmpR family regulator
MKAASRNARPAGFRSLSTKFFVFTLVLLTWVVLALFGHDIGAANLQWRTWALLMVIIVLVAGALSRFTIRVMARPLMLLEEGISSVTEGRLEPIQVSRTRDEIELLGQSFNRMIERLNATQDEVRDHRELLEKRIRERTEDLELAMQKAQAASQAKSEFLANMSHELRTPMNGVLGMIDIALDSPLTPEQREQLETAQRCARSLLGLLNDILDLSKIEAGKLILERLPFDLRVVLEDTVRAHRPKAARKGITISVEVEEAVPRKITADPLRIRQILSNLLSNAVKFTDRGSVKIRVSHPQTADEAAPLAIEVIDTGVGIAPDKLDCIFEKFTQADGSTSRKYGGTGLGLAITRLLVELHDGAISVQSEPGKGSTFRLLLPASVCLETGAAVEQTDLPPDEILDEERTAAPAILVVEDNHVNQKVVTALLRKRGYHVDVANHGREALEYLDLLAYGLVLMDIQMPVMDGLEATRWIRRDSRFQNLPIIAMTAHAMTGDRERCLAAGMNGYLTKPLNPATLVNVVEEFLNRSGPVQLLQSALASTEANPELMPTMQHGFPEAAQQHYQTIQHALTHGNFGVVQQESSLLRIAAEKAGSIRLAAAAQRIEQAAEGRDAGSLHSHFAELEQALEAASQRVCEHIEARN